MLVILANSHDSAFIIFLATLDADSLVLALVLFGSLGNGLKDDIMIHDDISDDTA